MLKHMALASFTLLCGCSDFWTSYMVINPDGGIEDLGSAPDLAPVVCAPGNSSFSQNGDTFVSCCDDNTANSSKNLQITIEEAQRLSSNPMVVIGCANPRQLSIAKLQSELVANEEALFPIITKKVSIDGQGCTLDAQNGTNPQRHFLVKSTGSLSLKNMKLINGTAKTIPIVSTGLTSNLSSVSPQNPSPTMMACGGSILAFGPVSLERVYLTNNKASHAKYAAGGALCLAKTSLTLKNSVIYNNSADSQNTGGSAKGSAVYLYSSSATVEHSSVINNQNIMPTNSSFAGAAFYFDDENVPGTSGDFKLVAKNSLFINYQAREYKTMGNQTQNYAVRFSCQMMNTESLARAALLSNGFDDALYVQQCVSGALPKATAISSDIGITFSGEDWAAPAGSQKQISPGAYPGLWDSKLREKSDIQYCRIHALDFFGSSRVLSTGQSCMPGAVEPRTN